MLQEKEMIQLEDNVWYLGVNYITCRSNSVQLQVGARGWGINSKRRLLPDEPNISEIM